MLGDTAMSLTDTRIRNAKPKGKPYKLSDGAGMYLLVKPDGARYWRLDYRFAGKRRTLALGIYPIVSLSNARSRREDARALLAKEIDPGVAKKASKRNNRHHGVQAQGSRSRRGKILTGVAQLLAQDHAARRWHTSHLRNCRIPFD